MFVRMTMFLMTMAMGARSGGIIMIMRMVIRVITMRTMRMVVAMVMGVAMIMTMAMRMVVTRVSFARRRKVVDEWDVHCGLLQQFLSHYAFVLDRPGPVNWRVHELPCRLHLGIWRRATGQEKAGRLLFSSPLLTFCAGNYHLSPHRYHRLHPSITPLCTKDGFGQYPMSKGSSQLTYMYPCLCIANQSCTS